MTDSQRARPRRWRAITLCSRSVRELAGRARFERPQIARRRAICCATARPPAGGLAVPRSRLIPALQPVSRFGARLDSVQPALRFHGYQLALQTSLNQVFVVAAGVTMSSEPETTTPRELVEMYLAQRQNEVTESTLGAHERRLLRFVRWCEGEGGIDDVSEITGRAIHEWRVWRQDEGSEKEQLSPETIRSEIHTLRVWLRFGASIGAVDPETHENIVVPAESKRTRNVMIEAGHAKEILQHLRKYRYASAEHAIIRVFWMTGIRSGTLRGLDVEDFNFTEASLRIRHRPEEGSTLKNGSSAERFIAIDETTVDVIRDYIDTNRQNMTDNQGRNPLFSTRFGRRSRQSVRAISYYWTTPCRVRECPQDRNTNECEATTWDGASRCPSSESTHAIRRGAITHHLRSDVPETVVSDRMDVSADVLNRHYNEMSETEKMEQRRDYLDNV